MLPGGRFPAAGRGMYAECYQCSPGAVRAWRNIPDHCATGRLRPNRERQANADTVAALEAWAFPLSKANSNRAHHPCAAVGIGHLCGKQCIAGHGAATTHHAIGPCTCSSSWTCDFDFNSFPRACDDGIGCNRCAGAIRRQAEVSQYRASNDFYALKCRAENTASAILDDCLVRSTRCHPERIGSRKDCAVAIEPCVGAVP